MTEQMKINLLSKIAHDQFITDLNLIRLELACSDIEKEQFDKADEVMNRQLNEHIKQKYRGLI
jgi:hypothetical protein